MSYGYSWTSRGSWLSSGQPDNPYSDPITSRYYNPEALKQVNKDIEKMPELEVGLNTYSNLQEYTEALDFGIYTFHTRGEILNKKGFQCLERLERNSSIYAATNNFKLSVIQPRIIVREKDKSYKAGLLKHFMEYNLAEMQDTIENACYDILSAIMPGYSISEKVFITDRFEGSIIKRLKAIKSKKPGLYAFYIDAFDNIQAVKSLVSSDLALPKEKFILYSFLPKHGNPYGFPLFDVLYPLFFAINELQKFMLISAAKFATPSLVFKLPNGASDSVKDAVRQFARNMTQSSVGTLPESVKHDILDITNKSGNPYPDLLYYFISEVEKVLLLNDLTVSQGRRYGTRAETSSKIEEGKKPLVMYTRRQLEDTLKEQLTRPLLRYNFDPNEFPTSIYPELIFDDSTHGEREIFVSMVKDLTEKGYMNPEKDSNYVREKAFDDIPKEIDDIEYKMPVDPRTPHEKYVASQEIQDNGDTDADKISN